METNNKSTIGQLLENELKTKKLTYRNFSEIIGISTYSIEAIINGKTILPSRKTLEKIALYFKCDVEDLVNADVANKLRGRPFKDDNFRVTKKDAIKAAEELCYGKKTVDELKAAKTFGEIDRVMSTARKNL